METQYPSANLNLQDSTRAAGNQLSLPSQGSSSRPPAHSAPAPHAHHAQQQQQQLQQTQHQHQHQHQPPQLSSYSHHSYPRVDGTDSRPRSGGNIDSSDINDSRHLRDLHAAPPPLRRLSAPTASSSSSSSSNANYLALPSLAPRSHAPPPAISIPPTASTKSRYEAPQSAPIVPPNSYRYFAPRSGASPGLPPLPYTAVPFDLRPSAASALAPHYSYSGASSPIALDERSLRSPHPPLSAVYPRQHWPPLPPTLEGEEHSHSRHFLSSPLGDNFARPAYPSGPHSPYPRSSRRSPVYIPPPLHFKYSVSPPDMPPRKKPSTATITSTPATVSSTRSSRRVAESIASKGNGWTTEHTYDSVGQPKEVIVIQDSSSPIPKKRTRAAAAAAAAAVEKWTNGVNGKKRKVEEEEVQKVAKPKVRKEPPPPAPSTSSSTGQPAWDDAEGHYIVKPDDVIGGRCKWINTTR